MSANFLGIRQTAPRRIMDNQILSSEELIIAREEIATNVKIWGAVGDGITDDTFAFNEALATGTIIHVPEGTYRINGIVSIPVGGGLIGDGNHNTRLRFYDPTATTYIGIGNNVLIRDIRLINSSGNITTSSMISVVGNNSLIDHVFISNQPNEFPAYGITYSSANPFHSITSSIISGQINAIRFTAAAREITVVGNLLNTGNGGVVVNNTNAGLAQVYSSNIIRSFFGTNTGFNLGTAAVLVGNTYDPVSITLAITGAAVATSTILDDTVNINTTAAYNVDGVRVVTNRQTGFNTTTTGANPSAVVPASASVGYVQAEATATMEAVNALKAAMITHGLIGA